MLFVIQMYNIIQKMATICEEVAIEFNVKFKGQKNKLLIFKSKVHKRHQDNKG